VLEALGERVCVTRGILGTGSENERKGKLTHQAIAEALKIEYTAY
jgi:hypothetical protein